MKHTTIILLLLTTLSLIAFKPKDESPGKKYNNSTSDNPAGLVDSEIYGCKCN
ncbi:MAG: hypothetical protein R3A12_07655 [Ignavibacteria bacterium]